MRKIVILIALLIPTVLFGELTHGFQVLAGVRYDNVRMCVASPAGVKGGPMADFSYMFTVKKEKLSWGGKIPLFRPIFFGAAFKMVQFEPELFLKLNSKKTEKLFWMPGLGVSVHYGPNYEASKDDEDLDSFWAFGPTVSSSFGVTFSNEKSNEKSKEKLKGKKERAIVLRPFVTPLFSQEINGVVAGVSLEYLVWF